MVIELAALALIALIALAAEAFEWVARRHVARMAANGQRHETIHQAVTIPAQREGE